MASNTPKKTPLSAASGTLTPARPTSPATQRQRDHSSKATPTSATGPNAISRNRSVRSSNGTPISARAAVKKPSMSSSAPFDPTDEDSRAGTINLIDDLKDRLQKAELAAEEFKRHNEALQSRLDDAVKEQSKLEEKMHEDEEHVEELENEKRELTKQKRELETIYEAERAAAMKDSEITSAREEELQHVIQRLKESLSQKDTLRPASNDDAVISRNASFTSSGSPTLDANHFAPPSLQRSNSTRNNSKLLLQKDKLIEELRLQLAELQIKQMEMESQGGGRGQELERTLMETRITNARLMEENESFQSLLMEKTLNGDFSQKSLSDSRGRAPSGGSANQSTSMASLADELASIEESDQEQDRDLVERFRRTELDLERQKAENKALTLYINKIIERILKHSGGFENILNHNEDEAPPAADGAPPVPSKDKDLPPPPPRKDTENAAGVAGAAVAAGAFLQRAKSIAYGSGKPRPRPTTFIAPSASPTVNEDPATAPRIPLQRNISQRHSLALPRRVNTSGEFNGAAAVVSNMYRGGHDHQEGGTTTSPGINSPRGSYFNNLVNRSTSAGLSHSRPSSADQRRSSIGTSSDEADDARQAALDALNGGSSDAGVGEDAPSPPRSIGSKDDRQVLQGNKMRPLRLVTEEQRKTATSNRQSWIPNAVGSWFNANSATGT